MLNNQTIAENDPVFHAEHVESENESLTKIFGRTKAGAPTLITWKRVTNAGSAYGHSSNLVFFEKKDGTLTTSKYQIGIAEADKRNIVATPSQIEKIFKDAGLPTPEIVRLQEPLSLRSLRATTVAVVGKTLRWKFSPQ